MASLEEGLYDLGRLDQLAYEDSPVHAVDPRAKVVATLVFLGCVVSFGPYEVLGLLPFAVFPLFVATDAGLPIGYLSRKLLAVAPFAIVIGILNPFLDRATVAHVAGVGVSGGWLSFASILLRFGLTTMAALVLIATTGFSRVCMALEKLGVPDVLVTQLLLLYRYIFVLGEETMRLARARALRSFGDRGMGWRTYASMLGSLLLRTYARAERIYQAMLARGFDGTIRVMRGLRFAPRDAVFVLGWSSAFVLMRVYNVPVLVGDLVWRFVS